jgi:hypothetical protein
MTHGAEVTHLGAIDLGAELSDVVVRCGGEVAGPGHHIF